MSEDTSQARAQLAIATVQTLYPIVKQASEEMELLTKALGGKKAQALEELGLPDILSAAVEELRTYFKVPTRVA